jgi:acyl-CoA synthetase (AMP-forming)/AMP-acid ligase II
MKFKVETYKFGEQSHVGTKIDGYEFLDDTIRDRIDLMARLHPDHVVFVFEQNANLELTYDGLRKRVRQMARNLLKFGFEKGDRLAFQLANTVETIITTLACAYIGVLPVAIDPTFYDFQMEFMLEKANPKGFIIMTSFQEILHFNLFQEMCPELGASKKGQLNSPKFSNLRHVFVAKKLINLTLDQDPNVDYSNVWDFEDILDMNSNEIEEIEEIIEWPKLSQHDPVFMIYTVIFQTSIFHRKNYFNKL